MRLSLFLIVITILISTVTYGAKPPIFLSWEHMKNLNYETGEMPNSLASLNNQLIKVEGFIVPLDMDTYIDTIKEFLLVPNPLACIHIPPPPPNQMIYITMNKAIPIDMDYRGVSITGTLNFYQQEDNIYGFELSGVSIST